MVKKYKSHPGIANGKTSDEALLAALCESEQAIRARSEWKQ